MNQTKQPVPEGYMQDSKGRLVPEEMVKPVDKLRDELVHKLVYSAKGLSAHLAGFKIAAFNEIADFVELSASEYGKKIGGVKGNVCLPSYDGRYKVLQAVAEHFEFDERLQIAKDLVDECIHDWSDTAAPELRALVNDAFQVDKKGNVDTKRILSLRKFDIEDERWLKAMEAISDSLTVAGSRTYIRVYERVGETDQFQQIPLDIAGVNAGDRGEAA